MFPGPVFFAEAKSFSRRARYFVARFAVGSLILLICRFYFRGIAQDGSITHRQFVTLSQNLFLALSLTQSIVICLMTPALIAPAIAGERSRGTLDDLLSSRLTSAEIILGKLFSRLLQLLAFLLVSLPIMFIFALMGGITPSEILIVYLLESSIVCFIAATSMMVSVVAPRSREAVFISYGITAFWLCITPVLLGPVQSSWPALVDSFEGTVRFLILTNPLLAFQRGSADTLECGAILTIASVVLLVLCVLSLRRSARRLRAIQTQVGDRHRFFPRPPIDDDAMMWKETRVNRSFGILGRSWRFIGYGLLAGFVGLWIRQSQASFQEVSEFGYGSAGRNWNTLEFNSFLRNYGTALYVLVLVATTSSAACSITTERESDTWMSILATPIEPSEILRAKRVGVYRRMRFLLACPIGLWLLGVSCGAIHPIGFVLVVTLYVIYVMSAVALGTFVSLIAKSTTWALMLSMTLLFVLHGGYLFACAAFRPQSLPFALAASPLWIYLSPLSYRDIQQHLTFFGSGDGLSPLELILTGMLSIVLYASLGMGFYSIAVNTFDRREDRPSDPV